MFYQLVARIKFIYSCIDFINSFSKMSSQKNFSSNKSEDPIWTGNEQFQGIRTFQMFWDSLVARMMKAGCYETFEEPMPEIIAGANAAAVQSQKLNRMWKQEDQRCRGYILGACPAGTPASNFLHRWAEAQAAAPDPVVITSELIRQALATRFAPLNNLASEMRQVEWMSLAIEHRQPCVDFCDHFLYVKALYDATLTQPVDDPTAVRRFTEALTTKKEVSLQTLAYFLSITQNLTLAMAIETTRLHDSTKIGQERVTGGKSSVSMIGKNVCGFCSAVGHDESQCRKRK